MYDNRWKWIGELSYNRIYVMMFLFIIDVLFELFLDLMCDIINIVILIVFVNIWYFD